MGSFADNALVEFHALKAFTRLWAALWGRLDKPMRQRLMAILLAFATSVVFQSIPEGELELRALDAYSRFRFSGWLGAPLSPPSSVAVIAIDEDSYQHFDVSPLDIWPRRLHARLIERLKKLDVKFVGFDLLFRGRSTDAGADAELAQALSEMPTAIVADVLGAPAMGERNEQILQPEEIFVKATGALANAKVRSDAVVRHFGVSPLVYKGLPSLSDVAVREMRLARGLPAYRDLLHFYGPAGSVPTIPYWRALDENDKEAEAMLRGRVVFVGYELYVNSYSASKDYFRTPFGASPPTFGVEIHATRAANLLDGSWFKRAPVRLERLGVFLGVLVFSWLLLSLEPLWALLVYGLVILPGWFVAAYFIYSRGYFVPGITATLMLGVATAVNWGLNYERVKKIASRSKELLYKLLPHKKAEEFMSRAEGEEAGDTLIEAPVLWTDLANFSTWTEKNKRKGSKDGSWGLNSYVALQRKIVRRYQGTAMKPSGDGIISVWDEEPTEKTREALALECALSMRTELDEAIAAGLIAPLKARMGLYSGPVYVGFFGDTDSLNLDANGHAVNMATRLESLNKAFGTSLLFTKEIKDKAGEVAGCFFVAKLVCAGMLEAVEAYTIFLEPVDKELQGAWLASYDLFSRRQFGEAKLRFSKLLVSELGVMAKVLIDFCDSYCHLALVDTWAGELFCDKVGKPLPPCDITKD